LSVPGHDFGGYLMGYRRKLDIVADMLLVAANGAKKTHIMYGANLSYSLFTKYWEQVRRAYLLSFERKKGHYVLTSKGKHFLEVYKEYSKRNRYAAKSLDGVYVKKKLLENLCSRS
jgi:predicted transcriptional regulator